MNPTALKWMVALNCCVAGLGAVGALTLCFVFAPHLAAVAHHAADAHGDIMQITNPHQLRAIALDEQEFNLRFLNSSADLGSRLAAVLAALVLVAALNAVCLYRLGRQLGSELK